MLSTPSFHFMRCFRLSSASRFQRLRRRHFRVISYEYCVSEFSLAAFDISRRRFFFFEQCFYASTPPAAPAPPLQRQTARRSSDFRRYALAAMMRQRHFSFID